MSDAPVPPAAPASPAAPVPPAPGAPNAAPAKKGIPIFVWVLLGCGGLVFLMVVLFVLLFAFVWHKVDQAVDVENGKVTLRGSKGETITVGTKDGKGGETGSFTFKDDKGTVTFGADANAKLPSWMPSYPDSEPEGCYSVKTDKGDQMGCTFETSDEPSKIKSFYESKLKGLGFSIKGGYQGQNGPVKNAGVNAQHADGRQVNVVAVQPTDEVTKVTLLVVNPK
jgi:hypothetical protein